MKIKRTIWKLAYPFCRVLHRALGLSYKWVNVGKAAWHPEYFDPLWHYQWFGDEITEMPEAVNLCGIMFHVSVADGLVTFSSRDFWEVIRFDRDPYDPHAMLWYIRVGGRVPACHVASATAWIEAVYGGSHEIKRKAVAR